jgi:predicted phosphodiesterase
MMVSIILNLGSITHQRVSIQEKSYAILNLDEMKIKVQYYDCRHQPLEKLHFEFLLKESHVQK